MTSIVLRAKVNIPAMFENIAAVEAVKAQLQLVPMLNDGSLLESFREGVCSERY